MKTTRIVSIIVRFMIFFLSMCDEKLCFCLRVLIPSGSGIAPPSMPRYLAAPKHLAVLDGLTSIQLRDQRSGYVPSGGLPPLRLLNTAIFTPSGDQAGA